MKLDMKKLGMLLVIISLSTGTLALAAGGKNAHNNPSGDPADETFKAPYANVGDGRMMVFCAEEEKLVVTPVDGAAVEVTCIPAEE